ncbi:hypothetical protein [Gemmata massiliana]|uniref:hypothetical protein n=1 Tax=Gemmata massiliana TaxID=1210884 RepID=UPI0013A69E0A|nr:hypothetical protein [Gemmata massiliana]
MVRGRHAHHARGSAVLPTRGRRATGAGPRPCPELKKHPTSGLAFCTWYANRKYHFRYFGKAGTPDADRRYRRFALEWATGTVAASIVAHGAHVADVVKLWIEHCVRTYTKYGRPTSEVHCNKSAMRHMAELYGDVPAAGFNTPCCARCVRP